MYRSLLIAALLAASFIVTGGVHGQAVDIYVAAPGAPLGELPIPSPVPPAPPPGSIWNPHQTFAAVMGDAMTKSATNSTIRVHVFGRFKGRLAIKDLRTWASPPAEFRVKPWLAGGPATIYWVDGPYHSAGFPLQFSQTQVLTGEGILIENSDNVIVEGIRIEGIAGVGIRIKGVVNDVDISGCTIEWVCESAIKAQPRDSEKKPCGTAFVNQNLFRSGIRITRCRINQTNLGYYRGSGSGPKVFHHKTETVSISNCDNCEVSNNHISNSMMEGIDFKIGTRGVVRNNLIEFVYRAAIYMNESGPTDVYKNIVRYTGKYAPQTLTGPGPIVNSENYGIGIGIGAGLWNAMANFNGTTRRIGGTAIILSGGDLDDASGMHWETGSLSGVRVFLNEVYWNHGDGISLAHRWWEQRTKGLTPCGWTAGVPVTGTDMVSACLIAHNTVYKSGVRGGIAINGDAADATNVVANNLVMEVGFNNPSGANPPAYGKYALNLAPGLGGTLNGTTGLCQYLPTVSPPLPAVPVVKPLIGSNMFHDTNVSQFWQDCGFYTTSPPIPISEALHPSLLVLGVTNATPPASPLPPSVLPLPPVVNLNPVVPLIPAPSSPANSGGVDLSGVLPIAYPVVSSQPQVYYGARSALTLEQWKAGP